MIIQTIRWTLKKILYFIIVVLLIIQNDEKHCNFKLF